MLNWIFKKNTKIEPPSFPTRWVILFAMLSLVIITAYSVVLIAYILITTSSTEITPAILGQVGDFLGGFWNPILSIITVAGLFVTIIIQNMQLRDARYQILSEQESERTRTQREQFFQLLEIFRDVTGSISVNEKTGPKTGKTAFVTWHSFFINQCHGVIANTAKLKRYVFKYTEEDALAIVATSKEKGNAECAAVMTASNPYQNAKALEEHLGEAQFREFLLNGRKTRPLFMKKYWTEIGDAEKKEIVIQGAKHSFRLCNHAFGAYFKSIYQILHFAVEAKRESEFFPIIKSQINVYEMESILANFACGYAKPDFIDLANKARILNDIHLIPSIYTPTLLLINNDLQAPSKVSSAQASVGN